MDNVFEKRVRAAAIAGWWTVLIAVVLVTLSWIEYLVVMSTRPAWLLAMCGPNIDWSFLQMVWISGLTFVKLIALLMALAATWLTLWARQLRKQADGR